MWAPFVPALAFERSIFVVLSGYFDESEDDEWFNLGAMFSTGYKWTFLTVDWKRCLDEWNDRLTKQGRQNISRFHASDCWQRNKEFQGWTIEERDKFLEELRTIIGEADGMHTISYSVRLAQMADIFGLDTPKKVKRECYRMLVQYLMLQIGNDVGSRVDYQDTRIPLIHDRTTGYDVTILKAFNQLKDDPAFAHRRFFSTIVPMSWEDSIPLQPTDMVAYECRRDLRRHMNSIGAKGGMKSLLELPGFGGSAFFFEKENLIELRTILHDRGNLERP
jgi:hypothetical protein